MESPPSSSSRRRHWDDLPATPPHGPFERSPSPPRVRRRLNTLNCSPAAPSRTEVVVPEDAERPSPPPSPDSACPICLSGFTDKSKAPSCTHFFCFECIKHWAEVKSECPLCKTKFDRIYHNIKSDADYEEYIVPPPRSSSNSYVAEFSSIMNHYYRAWQAVRGMQSTIGRSLFQSRPAVGGGRTERSVIYARDLWARELRDDQGRTRRCDPEFYRANEAQTHRIRAWLNRELCALLPSVGRPQEPVCERINALLFRFDIVSEQFRDHVSPFVGSKTLHFVHELYVFARSPYTLGEYDSAVTYGSRDEAAWSPVFRLPAVEAGPSNSSSSSPRRSLSTLLSERLNPRSASGLLSNMSTVAFRRFSDASMNGGSSHSRPNVDDDDDDDVEILTPPVARRSFAELPPNSSTTSVSRPSSTRNFAVLARANSASDEVSPHRARRVVRGTIDLVDTDEDASNDDLRHRSRTESRSASPEELPRLRSFVGRHIVRAPPQPEPEPEEPLPNGETVNIDSDSEIEIVEVRAMRTPELITLDDECDRDAASDESQHGRPEVQSLNDVVIVEDEDSDRKMEQKARRQTGKSAVNGPSSSVKTAGDGPSTSAERRFEARAGPSGLNRHERVAQLPSAASVFDDVDLDSGVRHALAYARCLGRDSAEVGRERTVSSSSDSDCGISEVHRHRLAGKQRVLNGRGLRRRSNNFGLFAWDTSDSD